MIEYKECENNSTDMHQIFLEEEHSYIIEPESKINQKYSEEIMNSCLINFQSLCKSLLSIYQDEDTSLLTYKINELIKFSKDTKLEMFALSFTKMEMTNFFITLLKNEIKSDKILVITIIKLIFNFTSNSIIIMLDFMKYDFLSELIENFELFVENAKGSVIDLISNFISEPKITEFGDHFDRLIQICRREFEIDDCIYESIHLLQNLASREDVINEMEDRETLFDIFYQIFNNEKTWLFSRGLEGIYKFALTNSGCEIITNDEKERAQKAVFASFYKPSEEIEYNMLLVTGFLYAVLKEDFLTRFHNKVSLQKLSLFLAADNKKIQEASLNIFTIIVNNHPQFIQSLIYNGFYVSFRGGLLWIFEQCSYDLKKSASYIVMRTVKYGDEKVIDYLIDSELIVYATETLTSDPRFFNDNAGNSSYIIDYLLYLLDLVSFKKKIIKQLIDNGIYEMILNFETMNEEIDQKFTLLKKIIEEQIENE